jgi:hypothetical protein
MAVHGISGIAMVKQALRGILEAPSRRLLDAVGLLAAAERTPLPNPVWVDTSPLGAISANFDDQIVTP